MPRATPIRRIALLVPMPVELRPLRSPLALRRTGGRGAGLYRGSAGPIEVVAALTGIGMRAGARAAERLLAATSPDWLVVVGIAGGLGASVAIGDLVVPERVANLESGETFLPSRLGDASPRGTLVSRDRLLEDPAEATRLAARDIVAIDMETAAIAAVCARHGCPWSVFRAISDRADDGSTDGAILSLAGSDGRPKLAAAARFAIGHPRRIPQLARLARGTQRATRTAARALVDALAGL